MPIQESYQYSGLNLFFLYVDLALFFLTRHFCLEKKIQPLQDMRSMNILIAAYSGLGNFVLRIPLFRKIKELYPEARIDIITGKEVLGNVSGIAELLNVIDTVHQLSKNASLIEKYWFFYRMRKLRYSVIFLPFDSKPHFLLLGAYLANIPCKVIHEQYPLKIKQVIKFLLFNQTVRSVPILQGRHEIDLNLDLLEAYLDRPISREYCTPLEIELKHGHLKQFGLIPKKYIVLQLGARYGCATPKTWDPENFRFLIKKLQETHADVSIVTIGSQEEYRTLVKQFIEEFPFLINTAGQTSVEEVISILGHAKLIIAHDSGAMHLANALNVPLIALFGPTDYTRTRPLGLNSHILYSKNEYFGSMYHFKNSEEHLAKSAPQYACMSGIAVEDVLSKIDTLIGK